MTRWPLGKLQIFGGPHAPKTLPGGIWPCLRWRQTEPSSVANWDRIACETPEGMAWVEAFLITHEAILFGEGMTSKREDDQEFLEAGESVKNRSWSGECEAETETFSCMPGVVVGSVSPKNRFKSANGTQRWFGATSFFPNIDFKSWFPTLCWSDIQTEWL